MAFNIGGCQYGSRAFASTQGPLTMAWAWPRQGLPVQGLFNGKWYDGQIRRCHYKEKDGLQTAEVYEVEVQWDGECSQSRLPVEQVRLRPSPEHPPVLRPWPVPPFVAEAVAPEVPPDSFEATCMACKWHEKRTWNDGETWWWCTLCGCWSAENHPTGKRHMTNLRSAPAEPKEVPHKTWPKFAPPPPPPAGAPAEPCAGPPPPPPLPPDQSSDEVGEKTGKGEVGTKGAPAEPCQEVPQQAPPKCVPPPPPLAGTPVEPCAGPPSPPPLPPDQSSDEVGEKTEKGEVGRSKKTLWDRLLERVRATDPPPLQPSGPPPLTTVGLPPAHDTHCLNDPTVELRTCEDRSGQWPWCRVCNCWSGDSHIAGKRHRKVLDRLKAEAGAKGGGSEHEAKDGEVEGDA